MMPNVIEIMAGDMSQIIDLAKTNLNYAAQVYNVQGSQFGAKGDGVADDSSKILAAVNAAAVNGGIVFFPPNTYRISTNFTVPSNVTLWFANGAKLSVDTGITVTVNGPIEAGLHQIFSGAGSLAGFGKVKYFLPQWWGAKGDGIANDTTALQSAITAAQAIGGIVYLSKGTYLINATLTVGSGLGGIIGESRTNTIIKTSTPITTMISIDPTEANLEQNLVLQDFTVDGGNAVTGQLILLQNIAYLSMNRVYAKNSNNNGIVGKNCLISTFKEVQVYSGVGYGFYFTVNATSKPCNSNYFVECVARWWQKAGMFFDRCNNAVLDACDIELNGTVGNTATAGILINDSTKIVMFGSWIELNKGDSGIKIVMVGSQNRQIKIDSCHFYHLSADITTADINVVNVDGFNLENSWFQSTTTNGLTLGSGAFNVVLSNNYYGTTAVSNSAVPATFRINDGRSVIQFPNLPSLPSGGAVGEVCVVSGKLYIYNGTSWVVVGTQT